MVNLDESFIKGKRILVAACGSIAAVKTPLLISSLVKAGAEIKSVITPSAAKLISPLSISTLSRHKCYQNEDQWIKDQTKPLHIELSEWAEIIVIAPLTTSTLAKWTHGWGEGLLASILLAYEGPIIAAAGMNTGMWLNQIVQKNWKALEQHKNVIRLNPAKGRLACDRIGDGKMANPELIELAIMHSLYQMDTKNSLNNDFNGLNLLVTAGPTQEKLDAARLITNRSSGRMGVHIAQAARFRGANVQLIHGPLDLPKGWLEGVNPHAIQNAEEMRNCLQKLQPSADAVVMAAAVADFRRKDGPFLKKINKKDLINSMNDSLEEVPDLLKEIVKKKKAKQIIFGFAALSGDSKEIQEAAKAKKLFKGCDLLMANPIDLANQGFGENPNGGFLIGPDEMVKNFQKCSKTSLSNKLLDALIEIYRNISSKN